MRESIERDLSRDGIAVAQGLFSAAAIETAREKALGLDLISDRAGVRKVYQDAHKIAEFDFFFQAPLFPDLFGALIGPRAAPRKNAIQHRIDNQIDKSPIVTFHIDAITPRYKVFLYLSGCRRGRWPA